MMCHIARDIAGQIVGLHAMFDGQMMEANHFVIRCVLCGVTIIQCGCPGPKPIVYGVCDVCVPNNVEVVQCQLQ